MEHLEMVEKLRERADITYEEAKAVLEANSWDLLDAVMELERQGKIASAAAKNQAAETEIRLAKVEEAVKAAPRKGEGIKEKIRRFFRYCRDNDIQVNRKGERILQVPLVVLLLAMLVAWEALAPIVVISLLFGVDYNFVEKTGREESSSPLQEPVSEL